MGNFLLRWIPLQRHVHTYYGVTLFDHPFLTPKQPSCTCTYREVFLDLRSERLISLLQQSSAPATSSILRVSGWEQSFDFTPPDRHQQFGSGAHPSPTYTLLKAILEKEEEERKCGGVSEKWKNRSKTHTKMWASLVVQCLTICLPMQGTGLRSLVWEDPTCLWATKSIGHNYWASTLEPMLCNQTSHCDKPVHCSEE